jgi:two-component system copper resistance phosphate regulon response regulator CusR
MDNTLRILVAEDDQPLASFLRKGLEAEHYVVDVAPDGAAAETAIRRAGYDLLILDLNLPALDGVSVLKNLRSQKIDVPVLVLTSRSTVEDRVTVLDLGADDYLMKPFSYSELSARVRALSRRRAGREGTKLRYEDLEIDLVARSTQRAGVTIELSSKEFALLEYLAKNAGRAVTRTMILQHVWKMDGDSLTNVVDVYINYLRRKLEGDTGRKLIHTVRGTGYRLGDEVSAATEMRKWVCNQ